MHASPRPLSTAGLPPVAPFTAAPGLAGAAFVPLTSARRADRADDHAAALIAEAQAWAAFALARARMLPGTVYEKALAAVRFSVEHHAHALAVPSKLAGVSRHQPAVRQLAALADAHPRGGLGLRLVATVEGGADERPPEIAVAFRPEDGAEPVRLGTVQSRHVPWLRPLLAAGVAVHLKAVTGRDRAGEGGEAATLGVNVLYAHVGRAVAALRFCAGPDPAPSAADVVLRCTREGEPEVVFGRSAGARVATGYEWGYDGAGPARLARAVLRLFCTGDDADALAARFKEEVIAAVPPAGTTIEAAFVRAWIARHRAQS